MKYKKVHLIYRAGRGPFTFAMMLARTFADMGYEVIPSNCLLMSEHEIEERISKNPDVDFILNVGKGAVFPEIIKKTKIPTAVWFISVITDSPENAAIVKNNAKYFDKVYTFTPVEIPLYQKLGVTAEWLPVGADPRLHIQLDIEKDLEVGFAGSMNFPNRIRIMNNISEHFKTTHANTFSHYVESINRTKINLNIGWGFFGNQMRTFEVLACGGFLLTNEIPEEERIFKDKKHLVYFNNNNILELVDYYLKHDDERKKIAQQGKAEVLKSHTYKHRLNKIIKEMI